MDFQRPPQDRNRFSQWVRASQVLDLLGPELLKAQAQGLAHLDAQLVVREAAAAQDIKSDIPPDIVEEADRRFLSYSWVLAAYELVRFLREQHSRFPQQSKDLLEHAHSHIERLRVPLAKLEPAGMHAETDYWLAIPSTSLGDGSAAWRVNDRDYISRRAVANLVLLLLQQMTTERDAFLHRTIDVEMDGDFAWVTGIGWKPWRAKTDTNRGTRLRAAQWQKYKTMA